MSPRQRKNTCLIPDLRGLSSHRYVIRPKGTDMKRIMILAVVAATALSACSTERVVDNTVDGTLFVGRTAVKGVVGAGKLAVRGTGAAINAITDDE